MSTSLALAAGSVGGLVQPVLFTVMMAKFGLRGALLLQAGIMFHCVLAGMLSRPLQLSVRLASTSSTSVEVRTFSNTELQEEEKLVSNFCNGTSIPTVIEDEHTHINLSHRRESDVILQSSFKSSKTSLADSLSGSSANISKSEESHTKDATNTKSCRFSRFVDCSVLKSRLMILFVCAYVLGNLGCVLIQMFIPPLARDMGATDTQVGIIASLISASEIVGKTLLALIADRKCLDRYRILMFAFLIIGIILQLSRFLRTFYHFIAFTISYGLFSGTLHSLYAPICVDFVGEERFHKAIGVLLVFQGLSGGIVGFLLGKII